MKVRQHTTAEDKEHARKMLLKVLKPGKCVYTILRHVSRSGMQRRIDLYTIHAGEILYLTGYACKLLGLRRHRNGGATVLGCGMDMGYDLVYHLGSALWPRGTRKPHGVRNGKPDTDGGYALKHRWL